MRTARVPQELPALKHACMFRGALCRRSRLSGTVCITKRHVVFKDVLADACGRSQADTL